MKTGIEGSFVISWQQTEVDGLADAPRASLGIGASWRWSGQTVRIDGPQDVIRLQMAGRDAAVRKRAARKAARITGLPVAAPAPELEQVTDEGDLGFQVTDGYASYDVTLIETGAVPLLLFADGAPPCDTDHWVVRSMVEMPATNRVTDQPTGVICFTPGTRIRTARGEVLVEELDEGDRIQTKDNGLGEVLWIGRKHVSGARLFAMPELRPIRLKSGALGADRPEGDLLVSPRHKMLIKGAQARALFNTDEVLVAAEDLIDDRRIFRDRTVTDVTYIHLFMDRHEVVFANGLETESFLPEGEALEAVDEQARARLLSAMPSLALGPEGYSLPARRQLSRAEAAIMGAGG